MSLQFDFTNRHIAAFGFAAGVGLARAGNKIAEIILQDNKLGDKNKVYVWDDKTKFDEVTLYRYEKSNEAYTDDNGNVGVIARGAKYEYNFAFESINGDYSEIFATPPMISLKRSKQLTITPVNNSDIENSGVEVVERYATEPYSIEWRGLLIDMENHTFPLDKMETLNRIFEFNGVWNVTSEILRAVGINTIFIQDVTFDFVEGYEDTISYTMALRQAKPLEYQLLNPLSN
ncbi:MAG: DUF6046 domain-containing protein [Bacteroidetes bacterium]|nr:DUF6046 domain-containing protein [Bacteroidota bacterium]